MALICHHISRLHCVGTFFFLKAHIVTRAHWKKGQDVMQAAMMTAILINYVNNYW